jgi:hypothetical protein
MAVKAGEADVRSGWELARRNLDEGPGHGWVPGRGRIGRSAATAWKLALDEATPREAAEHAVRAAEFIERIAAA